MSVSFRRIADVIGSAPRVHGNGFIQLDLNPEGTLRLHVWDQDVPRQKVATPIHDHVFDLRSEVMLGTLIHEEMEAIPLIKGGGTHKIYYAEQEEDTQNTILVPDVGDVAVAISQRLVLGAGSLYRFSAGRLHQTDHRGLTATIIRKVNAPATYGRPRVLVPRGVEPDNEFRRDAHDPAFLWSIIDRIPMENAVTLGLKTVQ